MAKTKSEDVRVGELRPLPPERKLSKEEQENFMGNVTEVSVCTLALVKVPICGADEIMGPVLMHLDCRLKQSHRITLARMRTALAQRHAVMADGRHVESQSDVVRWLLEQVESAAVA